MSTFTKFLNLFKWQPDMDGNEEFDIEKSLNENWDKVDTKLETYMTDLTKNVEDYKSDTDTQVENIAKQVSGLKEISISPTTPTSNESVWFKKGKNFVDFSKCSMGIELHSSDGTFVSNNDYYVTEYIPIIGGHTYTSSGFSTPNRAYYDENLIYISRTTTETAIAPKNAKYVVGVSLIEGYTNPQIVEGDVAIPYEPYIKNEIYVKNDNGVFEKFYSEDKNQITDWVLLSNDVWYKKKGDFIEIRCTYWSETGIHVPEYSQVVLSTIKHKPTRSLVFPCYCKNSSNVSFSDFFIKIQTDGTIAIVNGSGNARTLTTINFHELFLL